MPRFRVIRWSRIVEDAVVETADAADAFCVADANGSWRVVDSDVVDTDVEELA